MAVHVTRCPHCQTSFRVRDEHLSVAKGMVRCGSCLQVFKAAEHFVDEDTPAAVTPVAPAVPEAVARTTPAASQPAAADDDDFGLIHDDMDDDPIPEKLADDPFVDFNLRAPENRPRPKPRVDIELDESIFSLKNVSSDSMDFHDNDSDKGKAPDDDESWANALLEDDDSSDGVSTDSLNLHGNDEFNFDLPPPEDDDFQGFIDDDEDVPEPRQGDHFTLGGDDDLETETLEISIPADRIAGLQEEPLQLEKPRRRPDIAWGWLTGVVLMLVIVLVLVLVLVLILGLGLGQGQGQGQGLSLVLEMRLGRVPVLALVVMVSGLEPGLGPGLGLGLELGLGLKPGLELELGLAGSLELGPGPSTSEPAAPSASGVRPLTKRARKRAADNGADAPSAAGGGEAEAVGGAARGKKKKRTAAEGVPCACGAAVCVGFV